MSFCTVHVGVGGISVYLVNFGVYWIPNIIGGLNRDTDSCPRFYLVSATFVTNTSIFRSDSPQQQAGQAGIRPTVRGPFDV